MNEQQAAPAADETDTTDGYDAVVVGAGPLGLYQLYLLREQGLSVRCLEEADGVGGTWHWNRYPGARNDSQTETYAYSFSKELVQEWDWKQTFSAQPDNEEYFNYVADRFDLRRHIEFNSRVSSASYDESTDRWELTTESGKRVTTKVLVLAVGILSSRHTPKFEGIDSFDGLSFHTSRWPKEPVDLAGKRVAVIGTGSTGIQITETIAGDVGHLTVFQRTANYAGPLRNADVTPELQAEWRSKYPEHNKVLRTTLTGFEFNYDPRKTLETPLEERLAFYEELWSQPGFAKWLGNFHDIMLDHDANEDWAEFVRNKIRARVKDPVVAEKLVPKDHPFGSKRIPLETGYYDAFNQDNVVLVDVKESPIQRITPKGIQTTDAEYEFDVIIYATGFDAVTGPVTSIDITGTGGQKIVDKYKNGPMAYLTIASDGFPNMFVSTSTVISNYIVSGEIVVEWIGDCIAYMFKNDISRMQPTAEAVQRWVDMANEIGSQTMLMEADSWFVGGNIPGKARAIVMHPDSLPSFHSMINEEAAGGYKNFEQYREDLAAGP